MYIYYDITYQNGQLCFYHSYFNANYCGKCDDLWNISYTIVFLS